MRNRAFLPPCRRPAVSVPPLCRLRAVPRAASVPYPVLLPHHTLCCLCAVSVPSPRCFGGICFHTAPPAGTAAGFSRFRSRVAGPDFRGRRRFGAEHHVPPQVRDAPRAGEGHVAEPGFPQQDGERPAGPEFDMAALPQCAVVAVRFAGEGYREVFQVPVVRRGEYETSAAVGFEDAADEGGECPRAVKVLDDLHRAHGPEGDFPQFGRQLARRHVADEETAGIPPPVRLAMAMPCRDASMP